MKHHSLFSSRHTSPPQSSHSHHSSSTHTSPPQSSHSHHSSHSSVSPSSTPPRGNHRTFSETIMEENIDFAEAIITRWAIDPHKNEKFSPLFVDGDRKEARAFLESVSGLKEAMHYYVKLSSSSDKLVRAQHLMQLAMTRLEKEFYTILSSNRKNLDSDSVSGHSSRLSRTSISDSYEAEELSEEDESHTPSTSTNNTPSPHRASDLAMNDLKNIADCMIGSGYAKECVNIYKLIRKSIIDETLYYLGAEKLDWKQIQKLDWKVLEQKIKTWLYAAKIAVKTLFQGERILCDMVFSSSEKIAESCFTEISKEAAVNLFTFPENFGKCKKIHSPEKIFRALDLYDAIADMWPEIELIFSHESLSPVRAGAVAATVKLGEAVKTMLGQFEAAIQKDTSKSPQGGEIHPLTRYVMNFLVFLGDYSGALTDILSDYDVTVETPLPQSYFTSPTHGGEGDPAAEAITCKLAWLILVLLCKLDGKAATYNDVALAYLFIANNLNYVVSKVRTSSLGLLMGPEWIWTHGAKVKRYISNYERMGWSEVTSALPENPTADIDPQEVTERFRKFNLGFEAAYKKQSTWVIPDPTLRDEVKINLAKRIVPTYRAFYEAHRSNYFRELGSEPMVRYAPEDLNNYLSDLFFAGANSSSVSYQASRGR